MEWTIRSHGARPRTPEIRPAADSVSHLSAALSEYAVYCENIDRAACRAVLGYRRHLAALPAGLQHEHRRLGGADRADGRGCRDGRLHAALPGTGVRRTAGGRLHEYYRRPAGSDHPWRREAHTSQGDDG